MLHIPCLVVRREAASLDEYTLASIAHPENDTQLQPELWQAYTQTNEHFYFIKGSWKIIFCHGYYFLEEP